MDEDAIEKADLKPIQAHLEAIANLKTLKDLAKFLTEEHANGLGSGILFELSSDQDFANSQNVIAFAGRGALGLPDRDYLKTDAKSKENREKYVEQLKKTFILIGDKPETAVTEADQVMSLETEFAKSMLTRVELRDPHKLFHKMPYAKFKTLVPAFVWADYFQTLGLQSKGDINVTEPKYYAQVQKLLKSRPIEQWRAYLRWYLVHEASPFLSKRFVNNDFEFFSKYLRGAKEVKPRWRRCAIWTDGALGEALGQVFVTKTFTADTKARAVAMTKGIEDAMEQDLTTLPWLSPATRKQALTKLKTMVNKIGYPDKWRDYGPVSIARDDFFGNVLRADQFERHRQLAKIGKPLDRGEWLMTPPTVNAYYNPQMNDINFPAGVLQPPLFDPKMDDAPNFGNTGATIGHELTHAFDDEGRQFDAKGNLRDWWTKTDAKEFERRAKCVVDQYGGYIAVDDIHINGKLTNGEDIADLGGTRLAYDAWKRATEKQELKSVDEFTPEQRFFIGMAQWACGDERPELKREHAITKSALTVEISNQRCRRQFARVRESVQLSKGTADGAREYLSRVVIIETSSRL